MKLIKRINENDLINSYENVESKHRSFLSNHVVNYHPERVTSSSSFSDFYRVIYLEKLDVGVEDRKKNEILEKMLFKWIFRMETQMEMSGKARPVAFDR